jgi:copper(I)-binding protein
VSISRSTRRSAPRRTSRVLLGAVAVGAAAVLLTACGAGQTGTIGGQVAAVNGAEGSVGQVAVRDVTLQYPTGGQDHYSVGEDAPLLFTLVNSGIAADELTSISTPAAGDVSLSGSTAIPGGTTLVSAPVRAASSSSSSSSSMVAPTTSGSSTRTPSTSPGSPSATRTSGPNPSGGAGEPGTTVGVVAARLTGLTQDVRPGLTIPVTFTFAKAGTVTVPVPVGAPDGARE